MILQIPIECFNLIVLAIISALDPVRKLIQWQCTSNIYKQIVLLLSHLSDSAKCRS